MSRVDVAPRQRWQAALTHSPDETDTPALVPSTWCLPFVARENFFPLVLQMLCAGSHYAHIYIHTRNTSHLSTHSLACKMTARVQKGAGGKKVSHDHVTIQVYASALDASKVPLECSVCSQCCWLEFLSTCVRSRCGSFDDCHPAAT